MDFNLPSKPNQNEVKYSDNNGQGKKCLYTRGIETCKKPSSKEKIEPKFAI